MTPTPVPVLVVSGLPRSGTSMMMRMLAAGGHPLLVDDSRPADVHNRHGYFEYDAVRRIAEEDHWLALAAGKAVKVVVPLLMRLPRQTCCRVILMRRDITAVAASQDRMIRADGGDPGCIADWLPRLAALELEARSWCSCLGPRKSLEVTYEGALADPLATAVAVAAFASSRLEVAAMAAAIDKI